MTVHSPPRATHATPARSAPRLVEDRPLRRPDLSSPEVMTRRAWWLVVLDFLVPGSAQVLAGSPRFGRLALAATLTMWALLLLGVLVALLWRPLLVALLTNWFFLTALQMLLLAYAALWLALTIDTLRLARLVRVRPRARAGIAALAVVLVAVPSGAAAYAAQEIIAPLRGGLTVFASGPSVPPSDGYYNFLLLGADSGTGRDSMRFDSISVVSVHAETGAVSITGIPRDLRHAPFSAGPLRDLYPDGFQGHTSSTCGWGSGVNQLMNAVETCREDHGAGLYPDAAAANSRPAVEATKDAAEGILGIEIPYYVFIDMHGFADLVDALGGVDITVLERLPKGGGPGPNDLPLEQWATGWIEAGPQHMDGDTAQWYARSRYTTSDWDRMRRQRELQQAILAQATPATVLTRFSEVMDAGTDLVDTDIPDSLLPFLVELAIKAKDQPVQTLELTPEGANIDPEDPTAADWARIRDRVGEMLHPPTVDAEE